MPRNRFAARALTFTIAVGCLVPSSLAGAQTRPTPTEEPEPTSRTTYACVVDSSGGLDWKNGRWNAVSFKPPGKFVMTVSRYPDKVRLYAKGDDFDAGCLDGANFDGLPFLGQLQGLRNCINILGQAIRFSEKEGRGVLAYLHGGSDASTNRDSLTVMPFVCQPF